MLKAMMLLTRPPVLVSFIAGFLPLAAGVAGADSVIDIGGRTATVYEPLNYDPNSHAPVLMLLRGGTASSAYQERA